MIHSDTVTNVNFSDLDDCDGVDCNDGTCVDEVNNFHCDCDSGFTGSLCESSMYVTPRAVVIIIFI